MTHSMPEMADDGRRAERPILVSGPLVRAILENRKTQTRRLCKQGTDVGGHTAYAICPALEEGWIEWFGRAPVGIEEFTKKAYTHGFPCPYGKPGDRLWVRENFFVQPELWAESHGLQPVDYAATSPAEQLEDYVKKPSIHMPRWASRITLDITDVRVERVQDISEEDAKAEGCVFHNVTGDTNGWYPEGYRVNFQGLWDSINEKRGYGWDKNPWVWVVSFRRAERAA